MALWQWAGFRMAPLLLALPALFPPAWVGAANPVTAFEVMDRAEGRFRALRDYQCRVEFESHLGKRVETGVCQFWFKAPRLMRVRVVRGAKRGSEVAIDATGQIRGHAGGILSPIVQKLKPADSRLRNIRGVSMMEMDWSSFYGKFRERSARPGARVTLAPHAAANAPYELTLNYSDGGKPMRELYAIDPHDWYMVEGNVYEADVRVDHVLFRDVKLDTELKDSWFHL